MPSSDDDGPLEAAFAAARGEDDPGQLLARARVATQLFGKAVGGLGRFHVLERLGEGGMGVVYAAYDPELDRGVALKMVRVARRSRELALREAKALAQLSHPNIVPVFDVGFADDHVYIVMELVRGATLRAWVAARDTKSVVDAYRQVAAGLAAAHDAGIVHRDFKPDNALVGEDGRVRVVDFGLAAAIASEGSAAGTPGYMAPEQAAGRPVTAATDQYSVCVALREALPAPPKWIGDLVARGTAPSPADRFASMHELARALARDPSRIRRRRVIIGAALAAAVVASATAFAVGQRAARPEACAGSESALAVAWAPAEQAVAVARIGALSRYGREVARQLAQALAAHATSWIASSHDACVAHRAAIQSDTVFDRRIACLDRSRAARAAVGQLARTVSATDLAELARAAAALAPPVACDDVTALLADIAPPPIAIKGQVEVARRSLEYARVQLVAGRFDRAREIARTSASGAALLGYPPLAAEANLVVGRAMMELDDPGAASKLADVATLALAHGLDTVAIEAWARRTYLIGTDQAPGDALGGIELVRALAARSGSAFARGLLANNIGTVELARGDRDAARRDFEHAVALGATVRGDEAIELANARANLALVTDDRATREQLLRAVEVELAGLLGPMHPDTLQATWNRVMATSPPGRARDELAALCVSYELHPTLASRTAKCWVELADLQAANGDRAAAARQLARALELGAATIDALPEVTAYALLWRGDRAGAARAITLELAKRRGTANVAWWETFVRAKLELALARTGDPAARQRAIELFDGLVRDHPLATIERRLSEARAL